LNYAPLARRLHRQGWQMRRRAGGRTLVGVMPAAVL
jgi:hypothetical protein